MHILKMRAFASVYKEIPGWMSTRYSDDLSSLPRLLMKSCIFHFAVGASPRVVNTGLWGYAVSARLPEPESTGRSRARRTAGTKRCLVTCDDGDS